MKRVVHPIVEQEFVGGVANIHGTTGRRGLASDPMWLSIAITCEHARARQTSE